MSLSSQKNTTQSTLTMIVIAVLMLIAIMMFLNLKQQAQSNSNNNDDTPSKMLSDLRQRVEAKEQEYLSKGIPLPLSSSIDDLTTRINRDATELRENIDTLHSALSSKEQALSEKVNELHIALTANQQMKAEIAKLRNEIGQSAATQTNANILKHKVSDLQQQIADREKKITELSARPTPDAVNKLRSSLNDTLLTNEQLMKEINAIELKLQKLQAAATNGIQEADATKKLTD